MPVLHPPGAHGAELDAPEADGFVSDRNTPLGQEILDIPVAEIESVVEPDCVTDDVRRKSVAFG